MGTALIIGGIFSFIVVMAIAMDGAFHPNEEDEASKDRKDG